MVAAVIEHGDALERHPTRTSPEQRYAVRVKIDLKACEFVRFLTRKHWKRAELALLSMTSGSTAKRSPDSTFRRPSPGFTDLREEDPSEPISMQCQQTSC